MDDPEYAIKTVDALVPKSLDDIIRKNRDKAALRLTTPEEMMELRQKIFFSEPKAIMDEWSLISMIRLTDGFVQVYLLGNIRGKTIHRLTSTVQQIDLDKQLLITQSGSLYQLGKPLDGEHGMHQLMAICAIFHTWGFGNFLGVPQFFY
ncbi:MAG: hypothetical protein H7Z73_05425 [Candidatus Saccharibacteria bacterium]|nr:hypothetical protein [Moraxellaceae bacterium]